MFITHQELWPSLICFTLLAGPMIITDLKHHVLPLPLNLGLIGTALTTLTLAASQLSYNHLVTAVFSSALSTLLMLTLFIIARGKLGFADVILTTGITLHTGFINPIHTFISLWLGCALTLLIALYQYATKKPGPIPFGPGLIIATAATLIIPI